MYSFSKLFELYIESEKGKKLIKSIKQNEKSSASFISATKYNMSTVKSGYPYQEVLVEETEIADFENLRRDSFTKLNQNLSPHNRDTI